MPGRSYDLVRQTPGGKPGDGTMAGTLTVYEKANVAPNQNYILAGANKYAIINTDPGGNLAIGPAWPGNVVVGPSFQIDNDLIMAGSSGVVSQFRGINTVGFGVAPLYGLDKRLGVTAADASAKTLYTTTAANQLYLVVARLFGVSGTNLSATYLVKWTENGSVQTATLTVSGAPSLYVSTSLIQPDSGTAITVQLTALSGTSPVVNVAAVVMQAD